MRTQEGISKGAEQDSAFLCFKAKARASGQTSIHSLDLPLTRPVEDRYDARHRITRTDLVPVIIEDTNREHAYEMPAVAARSILVTSQVYRRWLLDGTPNSPSSAMAAGED